MWHKQDGKCALSGLQMVQAIKNLKSVGLDRKNSDGPYSPENIQLVCRWVNLGKGHHLDTEFIAIISELMGCQMFAI